MEYILIYSDKCNFSNQLKQYNIFNKLSKIVVNNKSDLNKIPEYVKEVPVLIIKNTIKKEINILKKNNLFEWVVSNSNNNVADNNSHNNQTNNNESNMLECNMLNTNFSNNFSFVGTEDNTSIDYAENFYSNYDNMGSDINQNNNNNNNKNNKNNNNNTMGGGIDTREKKSLDNAYDKLLAERDNEFKSIQRV